MIIVTGSSNGFEATFNQISGSLFAEVYLEDKEYKIIRRHSFLSGLTVCLNEPIITNEQIYFVRFFTSNEGIDSAFTEFFRFIPTVTFDKLILEDGGGFLLLESGDFLILE